MTAEIAILNKRAVALAADSAVTIGASAKTYNSANKLFMLSKCEPVGAMIYGNAEFMGVPWETILKRYRSQLGSNAFDSIDDYCDHFLAFLQRDDVILPESRRKHGLIRAIGYRFHSVLQSLNEQVNDVIAESSEVPSEEDLQELAKATIAAEEARLALLADLPNAEELTASLSSFGEEVSTAIVAVFERFPLSSEAVEGLQRLAILYVAKDDWSSQYSGVVVAGFGELDVYPRLRTFRLECAVGNELKFKSEKERQCDITDEADGAIIPFAQSEMVSAFMEGVDPLYSQMAQGQLDTLFDNIPSVVTDNLSELLGQQANIMDAQLEEVRAALSAGSKKILEDFKSRMGQFQHERYIQPILGVVNVLPVEELASMAETLVSLTSFKRRMSMDVETVGGPVDVAVISKGDGFIWINRKHYFKPDLNHAFFQNYFRRVSEVKES